MPIFDIILPVFFVIGVGFVVTRAGLIGAEAIDSLAKFAQSFAIPCLLFRALSQIDLGTSVSAPLIFSYYVGAFACFSAGFLGARLIFGRRAADAVAIGFCCLFSNTVLLGLPITERAYGLEVLPFNFAIIAFHAPLCYLLGGTAMEMAKDEPGRGRDTSMRVLSTLFRNPLVISILLGLFVNVAGLPIPGTLASGVALMAQSALPVALFAMGGTLVGYRLEGDMKTIFMIGAISLLLHPAIVLGAGTLFALDQAPLRSAVLTAAMAPGINVYIFANMYGAARRVAAAAVLAATAVSMGTIWFWIFVLA